MSLPLNTPAPLAEAFSLEKISTAQEKISAWRGGYNSIQLFLISESLLITRSMDAVSQYPPTSPPRGRKCRSVCAPIAAEGSCRPRQARRPAAPPEPALVRSIQWTRKQTRKHGALTMKFHASICSNVAATLSVAGAGAGGAHLHFPVDLARRRHHVADRHGHLQSAIRIFYFYYLFILYVFAWAPAVRATACAPAAKYSKCCHIMLREQLKRAPVTARP